MNYYLSVFLLLFIVVILVYSTYSFSQGRFMEGLSVVPALVGCYFLVMFWKKRQDGDELLQINFKPPVAFQGLEMFNGS